MSRMNPYTSDMTFRFSTNQVAPVGTYLATLKTIERTRHEEYGDGVRFSWQICEGPAAGIVVSRTCGVFPSATNAAGRLMSGVMGRQIQPGENVTLSACVGRTYRIVVGMGGKSPSPRVESCTPA
jgi:hypothetical protein